jgi:hypothetical protein
VSNGQANQPSPDSQQSGDTGSGFIQGVEPAQPRQASDWAQTNPSGQVSQPVQVVDQPVQPTGRAFSEEDIERARQQEKDKLYPRLSAMEEELKSMRQQREAEEAERQRLAEEAETARRAKEEGEMEVRQLLQTKEQEWDSRFKTLEQQREADRAIFDRERQLADLEDYRRQRIEQEAEFIMPELRDFVVGASPEEIDQSIEAIKARTSAILANITQASQQAAVPMRGAAPTAPPVGPMEQQPTYESLTPDDIRSMDMETYKRYRQGLLDASSRQYRGR